MKKTVYISAGHGGKDSGGGSNQLFLEKNETLKISKRMRDSLERCGFNVILNRETDKYIHSNDRAREVKESNADICIANHINSSSPAASGSEIIISIYNETNFADKLLMALVDAGFKKRRVFSKSLDSNPAKDYYFMHRLTGNVETYIVEYAFASNEDDTTRYLNYWEQGVENIIKVICERFGMKYVDIKNDAQSWKIKEAKKSIDNLVKKGLIDNPELHKGNLDGNFIEPYLFWTMIDRLSN